MGFWLDKIVLIFENCGVVLKGLIIKFGQFQNGEVIGFEVYVKDVVWFKGGWGFFVFDGGRFGEMFFYIVVCYVCYQVYGVVDMIFV